MFAPRHRDILIDRLNALLPDQPEEIIQQELEAITGNGSPAAFATALLAIAQRKSDIAIVSQQDWETHVLVTLKMFDNYPSRQAARKARPAAELAYNQLFSDHLDGIFSFHVEIGCNNGEYDAHAHLHCEINDYRLFQQRLIKMLRGPDKCLTSRIADKKWEDQTIEEYRIRVPSYNTKFSPLESWQDGNKRRNVMVIDFDEAYEISPLYIRKQCLPKLAEQYLVELSPQDQQLVVQAKLYEIVQRRKNVIREQEKARLRQPSSYYPNIYPGSPWKIQPLYVVWENSS
jgi:hypothetical protein